MRMSYSAIKELILDVLKPRSPSLPKFAVYLCDLECVDVVDISLIEIDEKTDTLKVVVYGEDIDFAEMKDYIDKKGVSIHSVDHIVVKKEEQ